MASSDASAQVSTKVAPLDELELDPEVEVDELEEPEQTEDLGGDDDDDDDDDEVAEDDEFPYPDSLEAVPSGISLSRTVTNASRPGRKIRASITTRLVGNLQRESQAKASWVTGILFFDHDPGFERVQSVVAERLMVMPRFRARMKARSFPLPQKFHFVEVNLEDFDIDYHLQKVLADGDTPPTTNDVIHFVENMYNGWEPDLSKPLWQLLYVPRLDDGRACLITKISHAIGDGVSQIEVLMRMLDPASDEDEAAMIQASRPPMKRKKKATFGPLNRTRIFLGGLWSGVFNVFSASDPPNSLRPKNTSDVSGERRFAFTEKVPLPRMKEVKNKLEGATLNDVLILLLTLTMREYFIEAGDEAALSGAKVSAQFPISTRSRGEDPFRDDDPRNQFSYGFLKFYVTFKGSNIDLFWKIKRDLDKIKMSPAPFVTTRTAKVLVPILPLKVSNSTVLQAANKATAQLSNVAAPAHAVKIAGARVTDMSFLIFSPLALYVGILSYNNNVSASVCLDANLGVDPNLVAKHWGPQFEAFYEEVMSHDGMISSRRSCLDCF
ncbi:Hypothetical Protein FCC1311_039011 [Hondaea fermentalgiana]|uniref:Uncharacterized protein n=1 Tax=Hondaea fermentalgiana TaxID=2315210 RepID=A0A2R5G1R7_9STRA|nr:Hypothetical Protein FCC1311_039011 [Hondaea fermentalgiana]|eukprot:GBG24950.1 Hypothetical Protein FCC1311_039011 [Hondaea fermentalgiana]